MLPRRRLAGAAFCAALLVMLAPAAVPAHAATPGAHGYWWRLQTGTGPELPPPPFVPSRGLWVASDASGQQAVSALRYRAPSGVEIRTLVLRVAQASGQAEAVLLACSARSSWSPAEAGLWDDRPATACDVAFVVGAPTADGNAWTFNVRGLARSGMLDVVILPPPDLRTTFSISFQRPGPDTVVTQRFPGSPSPSTSASAEESPNAGRITPSPPEVLGQKTTRPGTPSATQPQPQPSPGSPTALLAGPEPSPPAPSNRSRPLWLFGIAAALAVGVLSARALVRSA